MAKTKAYTELKQALLDNLDSRGMVEQMYLDKVDEYMDLWEQRILLKKDIEERGLTIYDEKKGWTSENRSVSLEVQVSRQMLALYKALGFTADTVKVQSKTQQADDDL